MILELHGVDTYYGSSHILQGVSLTVGSGEVVVLLGRNGAGKTTLMRSVVGLTRARRGAVRVDGENVRELRPHRIAVVERSRRLLAEIARKIALTFVVFEYEQRGDDHQHGDRHA